jgi:hypothetical protein
VADDQWDFYQCLVDDRPASIFVDLQFARPPVHTTLASTMYWLRVWMLYPGEHAIGTDAEATAFEPIERRIEEHARNLGLIYVGRIRSDGVWQLVFYGPAEHDPVVLARLAGDDREVEHGSRHDPNWDYYRDFLAPNAKNRQWMADARVVEALEEKGDRLDLPRRVDHWAYFRSAAARDAFVADALSEGFELQAVWDDGPDKHPHAAQLHRVDAVNLDHIHGVTMTLFELAARHGGTYDGWETSVEAG